MRQFLLGTDWWSDCDDAVAVRLLARAARKQEIRLLGIGVNACMAHSIASLDAFLNLEGICDLPLGLDRAAVGFFGRTAYQERLALSGAARRTNADAEDAAVMYRRLLAQADDTVDILEIGFPQVLAKVLMSGPDSFSPLSGLELFRRKVRKVWVMAGKWDEQGGREHNFCLNACTSEGAEAFCRLCPVPVTFLGWEIGADVITGKDLQPDDPLHQVLCDHGSAAGRMSWDPMLTLMALVGDEKAAGYRTVRGTASVRAEDGANFFDENPSGLHSYVFKEKENAFYQQWIDQLIG